MYSHYSAPHLIIHDIVFSLFSFDLIFTLFFTGSFAGSVSVMAVGFIIVFNPGTGFAWRGGDSVAVGYFILCDPLVTPLISLSALFGACVFCVLWFGWRVLEERVSVKKRDFPS